MKKFTIKLATLALCGLLIFPQTSKAINTPTILASAAAASTLVGLHGWYECHHITTQLKKELKWNSATPAERKEIQKIINQKTKAAQYRRNGGLAIASLLGLTSWRTAHTRAQAQRQPQNPPVRLVAPRYETIDSAFNKGTAQDVLTLITNPLTDLNARDLDGN